VFDYYKLESWTMELSQFKKTKKLTSFWYRNPSAEDAELLAHLPWSRICGVVKGIRSALVA
jgi:hypothetical protein